MVTERSALLQLIRAARCRTRPSTLGGVGLAALLAATAWHLTARISADEPAMQIRCALYGTKMAGEVPPRSPVTVRVSAEDGYAVVTGGTIADDDGGFRVSLGKRRITPGDIIEVDLRASIVDPLVARVPSVTARTDADRESISGEAPTGTLVVVTIDGNPTTREVVADGTGSYIADFSEDVDIEPPMRGRVELTTPDGLTFILHWAPLQTQVSLGSDRIWDYGPAGRHVAVAFRNASGALLSAAETYVDEPSPSLVSNQIRVPVVPMTRLS